ncbi:MAG: type II toxin-antitoxin system RelB/DinJ family antitoxin [Dehalococcoidia bacterium]|nr:type II toxin-antitoxin system RelB/DinJ family antitoxin [Chloroflexota bacterium]MXW25599.1 type II toxin-antitoxin system RelB/DinJ family antitoxin [Dehalococcoidia bacterium]MXZ88080.1 type II toxin-antitoxin system RelB/DinJ family antitoxin [Dehalococcoidia bacterium]MYA54079.1 type II toxin-antitoxin system RelB/DinJ family antitoxin [Dehalococcoidia bacterium]MYI86966.1 type II toxin-antitoxin system RelB/DinJ family antitoxin [Dehalococcoidia bacterium]
MAKTAMIRARVEPELKREAEDLFLELGMSATEAITLFYRQVTMHRGLPFDVRLPNAETLEALRDAREGRNIKKYATLEELKAEFD